MNFSGKVKEVWEKSEVIFETLKKVKIILCNIYNNFGKILKNF